MFVGSIGREIESALQGRSHQVEIWDESKPPTSSCEVCVVRGSAVLVAKVIPVKCELKVTS